MPIAAVPQYLGDNFKDASPGMRFGMYLKLWGINRRTQALLWQTHDIVYEVRGQQKEEREVKYENKVSALSEAKKLTPNDQDTLRHLANRQSALAPTIPDGQLLRLEAVAVAPFTTGLGNEHPLENGFAFLNPYGLPYLPGSGVKGVARRAAQELASGMWEDHRGWQGLDKPAYRLKVGRGKNKKTIELSVIDVLFGREPPNGDSDAVRGALSFWDVIPQIEGDSLLVEVMTPHQSHYYQIDKKRNPNPPHFQTPHDSGQPNPICFLTVRPDSRFTFHVVCDIAHLAHLTENRLDNAPDLLAEESGWPRWQRLIEAAFEHAFEWLGFGAKTAVGYGAMKRYESETLGQAEITGVRKEEAIGKPPSGATVLRAKETVWPTAKLSFNPGTGEIKASFEGKTTAGLRGLEADALRAALGDRANKLKKDHELKNVAVRVRIEGNMTTLVGLATPEQ